REFFDGFLSLPVPFGEQVAQEQRSLRIGILRSLALLPSQPAVGPAVLLAAGWLASAERKRYAGACHGKAQANSSNGRPAADQDRAGDRLRWCLEGGAGPLLRGVRGFLLSAGPRRHRLEPRLRDAGQGAAEGGPPGQTGPPVRGQAGQGLAQERRGGLAAHPR